MMRKKQISHYCIFFLFFFISLNSVFGQEEMDKPDMIHGSDTLEKNLSFIPIPYFSYDRSLGYQFGALPLAMYNLNREDTISPASLTGLLGLYTSNESYYFMALQRFYFNEDRWRITAAGGYGSINFQFYMQSVIQSFINYNTSFNFVLLQVQRKIASHFYGGFQAVYSDIGTQLNEFPDVEVDPTILRGIGIPLSFDTRDDVYYPRNGLFSKVNYFTFPAFLDNEFESHKIYWDINKYWSVRKNKDVVVGRIYTGLGIGDLSFQQQIIVGKNDLRGYSQGAFRGDQVYAIQSEYRWNLHEIFSLVGFGGVATVGNSINEEDNGKLLPAAGGGFRILVEKERHMNVGIDVAKGIDDWGVYFRLGEAF